MLAITLPCEKSSSRSTCSPFTHPPHIISLPVNPERDVKRVLSRFKLLGEQEVLVNQFTLSLRCLTDCPDYTLVERSHLPAHWEIYYDLRPSERLRRAIATSNSAQSSRPCGII